MADRLKNKIDDYCGYVNRAVKTFGEKDYSDSLTNSRKAAEAACKIIVYHAYTEKAAENKLNDKTLKEFIVLLIHEGLTVRKTINALETLQIMGNKAAHDNPISKEEATYTLNALLLLTSYLFDEHLKISRPGALDLRLEPHVQLPPEKIIERIVIEKEIDEQTQTSLIDRIDEMGRREREKNETFLNEQRKVLKDELLSMVREMESQGRSESPVTPPVLPGPSTGKPVMWIVAGILAIASLAVAFFVLSRRNAPERQVLRVMHKDTLYVAVNRPEVIQDNPMMEFKIAGVLDRFIQEKVRDIPVKTVLTDIAGGEKLADSVVAKKAGSLGYRCVFFGRLYESSTADSNQLEIIGYATRDLRIKRRHIVRFKSLSDSAFIKEMNDQANIAVTEYVQQMVEAKAPPAPLIKLLAGLRSYSGENSMYVHGDLAALKFKNGDPEGAIRQITLIQRISPRLARTYSDQAEIYASMNRFDSAVSKMRVAVGLDSSAEALNAYAGVLFRSGKVEEMAPVLDASVKRGANYFTYELLGILNLQRRNYQTAKKFALMSHRLHPYTGNRQLLGEIYANAGPLDSAVYFFEILIGKDSSNAEALTDLANIYLHSDGSKRPIADRMLKLAERKSKDELVHTIFGRGFSAFQKRDFKTAIADFLRIYKINPGLKDVLVLLAQSYNALGEKSNALRYATECYRVDSNDVNCIACYGMVIADARPESQKEVLRILKRGVNLFPYDDVCATNYLRYLIKTGQFTKAAEFSDKALISIPNNVNVMSLGAEAYFTTKDFKRAMPLYEFLNRVQPNEKVTANLLTCYLSLGGKNRVDEINALKLAREFALGSPQNATANYIYALLLLRNNIKVPAENYYRIAKRLDNTLPVITFKH